MTEMSVLTEAVDLNAVIDAMRERTDIDRTKLFLMGRSQGGFITTYVAGQRPQDIAAMVCFFPGYSFSDNARERTPDKDQIPETMFLMDATIGRIYNLDAMSVDIYKSMPKYPGDVLIFHGDADDIVPFSYSERAVKTFPSARLIKIPGAGHGFNAQQEPYATALAVEFVREHLK